MDKFIHYGIGAGVEAIRDAGLEVTEENAERIGVLMGSGIGGLDTIERNYATFMNGGPRKISPSLCLQVLLTWWLATYPSCLV